MPIFKPVYLAATYQSLGGGEDLPSLRFQYSPALHLPAPSLQPSSSYF